MKLLDDYFKLQREIYDYFGYEQDWRVLPIDDCTEYYWHLNIYDGVVYAETLDDLDSDEFYSADKYSQEWIYQGKDYTMLAVDTHTDGNMFLMIFDKSKQQVLKG